MKRQAWIIVFFTIITAGCAVSEKKTSYNHTTDTPPNQLNTPNDADNAPLASDEFADDDFDLLEQEKVMIADPFEPLNRFVFQFNDTCYFLVLKPLAQAYKDITPEPTRIGINNFFNNLAAPVRFANCLLQGKTGSAGIELHRFAVNTTEGILGLGDPAWDKYGLEPTREDLGQTLGVLGLENGFYLVLPVLGPSTLRDTIGFAGDQFLNPISYVEPVELSFGIYAAKFTNKTTFHIGEYEDLKSYALDPYVVMRDVYIQYRNKEVRE